MFLQSNKKLHFKRQEKIMIDNNQGIDITNKYITHVYQSCVFLFVITIVFQILCSCRPTIYYWYTDAINILRTVVFTI